MTFPFALGMAEATRLTCSGRLIEAAFLIQRVLHGENAVKHIPPAFESFNEVLPKTGDVQNPGHKQSNPSTLEITSPSVRQNLNVYKRKNKGLQFLSPVTPPSTSSFVSAYYSNSAGSRDFKLFSPSNPAGPLAPLVIMLHGCTQSADDFATETGMNQLAEKHGFFVAYPIQSSSSNPLRCWNWFLKAHQMRNAGEPAIIAGVTREIIRKCAIDPRRVYVAGLSAGGATAAILGVAYPDLYAGIGIHSGLACGAAHDLTSAFAAMRRGAMANPRYGHTVPTIVFHGDHDINVHPLNGNAVIAQAIASSGNVQTSTARSAKNSGLGHTRTSYKNEDGRTLCEHWTIHGGGHAWSGGCKSGTFTNLRGPNASSEMVRFFFENHLNIGRSRVTQLQDEDG